ncbi:MAG: protein kinase [Pirellulales bacterium]
MALCPKCSASVKPEDQSCPKCGAALITDAAAGGTLDVVQHAAPPAEDLDATIDSVHDEPAPEPNEEDSGTQATLDAADVVLTAEGPLAVKPSGTHVDPTVPPRSDTEATIDSPFATQRLEPPIGDDANTYVLPKDGSTPLSDSGAPQGTAVYNEAELREAMEGKGKSGTAGRLKRLWEGAAGTSENPMHSLSGSGALASSSVFERISKRRVAEAATEADDSADYQITKKLGEGAMGEVYAARQRVVDRDVALKMIKPSHAAGEESRRKFFYEAQITADLDHPNIVPIHELGQTQNGALFYAMKKIEGREWKDTIAKMSRDQNIEIFMKVADAVGYAHSKRIIHRDLKPENTMIGQYGEVYVTDWGLAINLKRNEPFGLAGTPIYMAPEMAAHVVAKIGPASDVYVLGAILYQIVTGRAPHTGRTVTQCLRAAVANEIVKYDKEDPLLNIALKAMATEPQDRYASVDAMQEAIREYRKHAESLALSRRSEETLALAESSKDYEKFSKAIFGFRDAIEMWAGNTSAADGLKKARLAYAQCAFAKGDYDLVIQTVDRHQPLEGKLYNDAVKAKQVSQGREKRLKAMRNAFVGVIAAAFLLTCGFLVVVYSQKAELAKTNSDLEQSQKSLNDANEGLTKTNKALEETNSALVKSQAEEAKARKDAEEKEAEAKRLAALEEKAKNEAVDAKKESDRLRVVAEKERTDAVNARNAEQIAKQDAERRAAEVQLGEYRANVALVKAQLDRFDVTAGTELLAKLKGLNEAAAFKTLLEKKDENAPPSARSIPKFDTWPWQRMNLLTNADLPRQDLKGSVQWMDFASQSDVGIVGMADGTVHIVKLSQGGLTIDKTESVAGAKIVGVAIAPDGSEAVFSTSGSEGNQFFVWPLNQNKPMAVAATEKRLLQRFGYTPDGSKLIAGINEGLWIWDRKGEWYKSADKNKIENLRGTLLDMQLVDGSHAFLSMNVNGKAVFLLTDLVSKESRRLVIPDDAGVTAAAHVVGSDQVILGYRGGSMAAATYKAIKRESDQIEMLDLVETKSILPKQHRSDIKRIVVHPTNALLTLSEEPVSHVWRSSQGTWQYDSYLTGTPKNINNAAFMGSAQMAMGVDEEGTALVWDVKRQKQRRQLTPNDLAEGSAAPVVGVFSSQDASSALAVDENGAVELWNLIDGKTKNLTSPALTGSAATEGTRWSYIGHTPGAQCVDAAADAESHIVVTSALLDFANPKYLPESNLKWEFCVWDTQSGKMLHRWYMAKPAADKDDPVTRRISLLDHGRKLFIASDKNILLTELDGKEVLRVENAQGYFAVPNPIDSDLVMLVRRDRGLVLADLKNPESWKSKERRNDALYSGNETPVKGVWSPRGDRFYMALSNGGLAAYNWDGKSVELAWSHSLWQGRTAYADQWKALKGTEQAVLVHHDLDIAVYRSGSEDIVTVVRRTSESKPRTSNVTLAFGDNSAEPSLREHGVVDARQWLENVGGRLVLTDRLHDSLALKESQFRSRQRIGTQTFVSTKSGVVLGLTDGTRAYVSLGRQAIKTATADRSSRKLLSLYVDGSLRKLELVGENKAEWSPVAYQLPGAESVKLSPDGKLLFVTGKGESGANWSKVIDAEAGTEKHVLGEGSAAVWNPGSDASLIVSDAQGTVSVIEGDNVKVAAKAPIAADAKVTAVHYFTESWSSSDKPSLHYAMVQSENAQVGFVHFVLLDGTSAETSETGIGSDKLKGVRLAASPTEAVFVTGDVGGTVTVWTASPSWDAQARQLFDLDAPRGAAIRSLAFSADGKTVVTGDSQSRLSAWLSADPLKGLSAAAPTSGQ